MPSLNNSISGKSPDRTDENKADFACSACHRRKLKCDRVRTPPGCSTCRKSAIPCVYTDQRLNEIGRSTTRAGRKRPRGPYKKGQTPREKELEHCVQLLTTKCSNLEDQLKDFSEPLVVHARRIGSSEGTESARGLSNVRSDSPTPCKVGRSSFPEPEATLVLELWLRYVSAVDPFNKLIHCPTVSKTILSAAYRPTLQPSEIQALTLSICVAALNSLQTAELQYNLDCSKEELASSLQSTLDHLLLKVDGDSTTVSFTVLQAALIYLGSLRRQAGCDRSLNIKTLFNIIVRLALRLGLHDQLAYSSLSLFEAEYRRRAWWTIHRFKSAYIEDFAKRGSILSSAEIPLPSNYNDDDLAPSMTVYPAPRDGLSELTIMLIQFKVVQLLSLLNTPVLQNPETEHLVVHKSSDIMQRRSQLLIEDTKNEIEQEILSRCDASRPFDWLVLLVSKVILTKVEVMLLETLAETCTTPTGNSVQDQKVLLALDIIECHQIIATDLRLQQWRWHWKNAQQWHATIDVLEQVAKRPEATWAGRVWKVINVVMVTPNLLETHGMDAGARMRLLDTHERALQARERLLRGRSSVVPVGTG